LIAARVFSWTRIGAVISDGTTSFHRGQMKNARSFFFAIVAYFAMLSDHAGRRLAGGVRRDGKPVTS
jgi:hypothetical protein